MGDQLLTVLIVSYNSSAFVEVSLFALAKLTKNNYKVSICDNGSSWMDKRRLKRIASKYKNVDLIFRKQSASGSIGHGEALNILINTIDTPYGVILDADAIFLRKNWDELLISQLDDKTKIIGAPPVKNPVKPIDFPLTYAVLFDAQVFKSLVVDMRPKNRKLGQDTGWEMREKFLDNGYTGEVLQVRETRQYKEGPFGNVICGEYYLEGLDDIFACHFGRGSSLGAAKYKEWNKFMAVPGINHIGRRIRGYRERKEWLAICRKIVEAQ